MTNLVTSHGKESKNPFFLVQAEVYDLPFCTRVLGSSGNLKLGESIEHYCIYILTFTFIYILLFQLVVNS